MSRRAKAKPRITISIDQEILDWIKKGIDSGRFGDYSHAFRYGIICAQREDELKHKIEELEKIIADHKKNPGLENPQHS